MFGYTLAGTKRQAKPRLDQRWPNTHYVASRFIYGAAVGMGMHIFFDHVFTWSLTWGPSMLPTLNAWGTTVFISKYYRRGRGVQVGDLVSFKHPIKDDEQAIKRVIGMPGDFVLRDTPAKGDGAMIQVPLGHCWVVGDNMPASRDSRMYGPIPLALIKGKVVAAWSDWFEWPRWIQSSFQDVPVQHQD